MAEALKSADPQICAVGGSENAGDEISLSIGIYEYGGTFFTS